MKKYSILLLLNIAFNLSAIENYSPKALQKAATLVSNKAKQLISQNKRNFFYFDKDITNILNENKLYNKYITSLLDAIIFKQLNMKEFRDWALTGIHDNDITSGVLDNFFKLKAISERAALLYTTQDLNIKPVVPFEETINRITVYTKNPFNDTQYQFITNEWLAVNPEDQDLTELYTYTISK